MPLGENDSLQLLERLIQVFLGNEKGRWSSIWCPAILALCCIHALHPTPEAEGAGSLEKHENEGVVVGVVLPDDQAAVVEAGRSYLKGSYVRKLERVDVSAPVDVEHLGEGHFGGCAHDIDVPGSPAIKAVSILERSLERLDASSATDERSYLKLMWIQGEAFHRTAPLRAVPK